jgi:hypothetical protein
MKSAAKKQKRVAALRSRRKAPLRTPSDLPESRTTGICGALNALLADVYALYLKTRNAYLRPVARRSADTRPALRMAFAGLAAAERLDYIRGVPGKMRVCP